VRIGVVVDGKAEFASLPLLYPRLQAAVPHQLVNPILADIQPLAPVSTIAKKCLNPARQLSKRGVERVVILVDRETRAECCATLSRAIEQPIANPVGVEVHVILKDRAFENLANSSSCFPKESTSEVQGLSQYGKTGCAQYG
jgi:hypothetical protein